MLQVFQYALANYIQDREMRKKNWKDRLKLILLPSAYPFRAVECGVYTGSSLIACGSIMNDAKLPYEIIGLDTFSGLPTLSDTDKSLAPDNAPYLNRTLFDDTSLEAVQGKIEKAGLSKGITLIQGLFSETLRKLPKKKYHFVNIDCDLYEPHIECLEYFYSKMVRGGVIFFDDYHSGDYPMARKAIDEFMKSKAEKILHIRFGDDAINRTKSFIIKY